MRYLLFIIVLFVLVLNCAKDTQATVVMDRDQIGYAGNPRETFVPEPRSAVLAAFGLIGFAASGWRRKRGCIRALLLALTVACADDARAVTIAWSPVGDPGNAPDTAGFIQSPGAMPFVPGLGAVGYSFDIGTYDVTTSQYVEFLNAKDPTGANTFDLYNGRMSNPNDGIGAEINFTAGNPNGEKYTGVSGRENWPVTNVTTYEAMRFTNWLNNGQGNGDTETGSYTLLGGTPLPANAASIVRDSNARIVLPTDNEWYKAAYYNPSTHSYFTYGTSSNTQPTAGPPPGGSNSANYYISDGGDIIGPLDARPTDVGAYTQTTSPYGAFDMYGNVFQLTQPVGEKVQFRGFPFNLIPNGGDVAAFPTEDGWGQLFGMSVVSPQDFVGFRVAMIVPEPSSVVLAALGLGSLIAYGWRRKRA